MYKNDEQGIFGFDLLTVFIRHLLTVLNNVFFYLSETHYKL